MPDDRPNGHVHDFGRRGAAMHFLSHPMPAVLRLYDRFVKKIREIVDMSICTQNHVAAAAAIAAIRSTFRHKFLPPKTHATPPAVSSLRKNLDPIDKHFIGDVKALKGQKHQI